MAVGYRSSSNTGGDTFSTSKAVPVPTGAAAGDVALVALGRWETTNPAVTPPSGFTSLVALVSVKLKLEIFWKRLTTAETGSWTFSWTGSQWVAGQAVLVTGGLSSGDPVPDSNSATATSNAVASTSITAAAYEPFLAHFVYNESAGSGTAPTNFTEVQDQVVGKTSYRIPGSTGSFTASGGTLSVSTLHHAALVAVKPEPTGGTSRDLVGIGPAAAGITGSASVDRPFAGSAAAAGGATGMVGAARSLTATAGAACSATGELARDRPLDATSAAASDGSGTLTIDRPLTAHVPGAADATGLLATARDYVAFVTAAGDISGTLDTARALTGFAASAASATGELTASADVVLDGSATVASDLVGTLIIGRDLAGVSAVTGALNGDVTITRELRGISLAASTITGQLATVRPLTAAAAAAVAASAELSTFGQGAPWPPRAGTFTVRRPATGTVSVRRPATGTTTVT